MRTNQLEIAVISAVTPRGDALPRAVRHAASVSFLSPAAPWSTRYPASTKTERPLRGPERPAPGSRLTHVF